MVEYNAIKIDFINFKAPSEIENAIITSQNSVIAIQKANIKIQNCYCVGEKTKALLERNGPRVIKMTEYASELAPYLVENHRNDHFHFFCGNIRSDVIPSALSENNISFEEIKVYNTNLEPKKIERQFDAIMFFSPSGVRSYFNENKTEALAVCIGTTTASEAKNYTNNVVVSNATLVESVIAKTVKMLRT